MLLSCLADLCSRLDQVKPGDRVQVIGVYKPLAGRAESSAGVCVFVLCLLECVYAVAVLTSHMLYQTGLFRTVVIGVALR